MSCLLSAGRGEGEAGLFEVFSPCWGLSSIVVVGLTRRMDGAMPRLLLIISCPF